MTYEQSTGYWRSGDGRLLAECYSGFSIGKNNPDKQDKIGLGPIPRGRYTGTGPEHVGPGETSPHGPYVIRWKPDNNTRVAIIGLDRGPDSFLAHGDNKNHDASHGCVIPVKGKVDGDMVLTGRPLREALWKHGETENQQLDVVRGPWPLTPSLPPAPVVGY